MPLFIFFFNFVKYIIKKIGAFYKLISQLNCQLIQANPYATFLNNDFKNFQIKYKKIKKEMHID